MTRGKRKDWLALAQVYYEASSVTRWSLDGPLNLLRSLLHIRHRPILQYLGNVGSKNPVSGGEVRSVMASTRVRMRSKARQEGV